MFKKTTPLKPIDKIIVGIVWITLACIYSYDRYTGHLAFRNLDWLMLIGIGFLGIKFIREGVLEKGKESA